MMKRDWKEKKLVAGEWVSNKETIGIANSRKNVSRCEYRYRDIDEVRLEKWEVPSALTTRECIPSSHHTSTPVDKQITRFRPARKQGTGINFHTTESLPAEFKPSIRVNNPMQLQQQSNSNRSTHEIKQRTANFYLSTRQPFEISNEVRLLNEKAMLLPHMRSALPNVKHQSEFKNSDELDIINQMHAELPHMRTKTPNDRQKQTPVQHVISNQTDFINQNKHVLPSMRTRTPNLRNCLTERNLSQFTLAWPDA